MTGGALETAFVYLAAGVAGVPLAKRFGLGSVLGYLLAGVVVGPSVLGLVGEHGHEVMHFSEFGVVMMLFLVGLELRPSLLWELRRPILGLGGLQVVGTAAAFGGAALAFGVPWKQAVAIGLVLAMSSTAIVLQSLGEKRLLHTGGGQGSFATLLFQDIAVIPILAAFPLLAADGKAVAAVADGPHRPGWQQALLVAGAVALVVGLGRFAIRPVFRAVARTRQREVFTAAALLLVIGIALLMQRVDVSPALGTFLAGVVLAESEYRHELESDIEPFKGLLLGVFFISVGAQIDFAYVRAHLTLVLGLVAAITTLKLLVLLVIGRVFGLDRTARVVFAFALAQVGEFAFVLFGYGETTGVFGKDVTTPLTAVVALSMALAPLLFVVLERVVLPGLTDSETRAEDEIHDAHAPIVVAGHGRFGQVVSRLLRSNGFATTVLDLDPGMTDVLQKLGIKVYYGDASRLELLHAAGSAHAKLFVLAVDDPDQAVRIAEMVRKHFPGLTILARARNRAHYYELRKLGVEHVYRETFDSALAMGVQALRELGFRAHTAHRLAQRWRAHERHTLDTLGKLEDGDDKTYYDTARAMMGEAERLMRDDSRAYAAATPSAAWDDASLRRNAQGRAGEDDVP